MSLLEDIKAHYEADEYPPDGPDLDYVLVDNKWVKGDTVTELVSTQDLNQARWGTWFENVYRRPSSKDGTEWEFVAIRDCRPATEYQSWGDYGKPEIYEVRPVDVVITTTKYEKV